MLFLQQPPPPPPPAMLVNWLAVLFPSLVAIVAIFVVRGAMARRRSDMGRGDEVARDLAEEVRHLRWRLDGLERDVDELRKQQRSGPDDRVMPK